MSEITIIHESYAEGDGLKLLSEIRYPDGDRVEVKIGSRHVGNIEALIRDAETFRRMKEFIRTNPETREEAA